MKFILRLTSLLGFVIGSAYSNSVIPKESYSYDPVYEDRSAIRYVQRPIYRPHYYYPVNSAFNHHQNFDNMLPLLMYGSQSENDNPLMAALMVQDFQDHHDLMPLLLSNGGLGAKATGGFDPVTMMMMFGAGGLGGGGLGRYGAFGSQRNLLPLLLLQNRMVAKTDKTAEGDKPAPVASDDYSKLLPLLMMQGGFGQGGFGRGYGMMQGGFGRGYGRYGYGYP